MMSTSTLFGRFAVLGGLNGLKCGNSCESIPLVSEVFSSK